MIQLLFYDENQNRLDISRVSKFDGAVKFNHLAVKYVVSGCETYYVNGKKHKVFPGNYLLANHTCTSEAFVEAPAMGVCIDISTKTIQEVARFHFHQEDFIEFLMQDSILVNTYFAKNTELAYCMNALVDSYHHNRGMHTIDEKLFYQLAEFLVLQQAKVFQ